jgi:hypothetical protein
LAKHSSGCAIANKVNSLLKGDHKNITLVDLDGFAPSGDQIKGATAGQHRHDRRHYSRQSQDQGLRRMHREPGLATTEKAIDET